MINTRIHELPMTQDETIEWMQTPNDLLDGKTPSELLETYEGQLIVASLVDDMLTGHPK